MILKSELSMFDLELDIDMSWYGMNLSRVVACFAD